MWKVSASDALKSPIPSKGASFAILKTLPFEAELDCMDDDDILSDEANNGSDDGEENEDGEQVAEDSSDG